MTEAAAVSPYCGATGTNALVIVDAVRAVDRRANFEKLMR